MTASMAFCSALGVVAEPVGACFFSSRMRAPILPSRSGGWCASGHVPALSRAKPRKSKRLVEKLPKLLGELRKAYLTESARR